MTGPNPAYRTETRHTLQIQQATEFQTALEVTGLVPSFPRRNMAAGRPAKRALISVVATSYLLGVSTGRVEKTAETLGITTLSKSQVSELAKSLDAAVEQFRPRPLDAGPYRFVQADAMTVRVCGGGRTVLARGRASKVWACWWGLDCWRCRR